MVTAIPDHNRRMVNDATEATENNFAKPTPRHVSDVGTWLHADRNYYVFVALTFLFGFVGLDHMYLRSNETAFKKLLLNIFGLGIWYVWDIIQVMKDGKAVRKNGLNSPFDWIRGIGRGMFIDEQRGSSGGGSGGGEYAAPKSYFVYTLLAICLGVFGADKFYLGHNWQGIAKVFSVFNIFLFLFGILWVVWDAVHAYFMTKTILKEGVTAPIPFSWFFSPIDPAIFKVQKIQETNVGNGGLLSWIPWMPWRDVYKELVVPVLQPTVGSAIQSANKIASVGSKAAALGTAALASGPAFVGNLASQVQVQAVQQAAAAAAAGRSEGQAGGGLTGSLTSQTTGATAGGPGPILAGAFTAILLAGGLKGFYDFMSKHAA